MFVASGGVNNGVTKLCRPKDDEILDKGNCLTVSPVDGSCHYQPTDFLGRGGAGSSIILLYAKNFTLNRYSGLFISLCIFKTASAKYSYGHMASVDRIMKDKILLPATNDGKPDFDFMATFMRQVEKDILTATIPLLQHRLDTVKSMGGVKINELQWNEFKLDDLFTISSGVRLTVADMLKGNIPFIGASDSNNGITAWVSNNNASLDQDVLGVNYNGSVCETFFHPYKCLFSDDVKRLHCKQSIPHTATKYIYLFLKQAILQQKSKYAYGYKFNAQRMKRQTLLLPVTADGTPDWQFMESYMRNLESQQIAQYLAEKIPTKYT